MKRLGVLCFLLLFPAPVTAQTGLYVNSSGDVGVGTDSPSDELEVVGSITTSGASADTTVSSQTVEMSGSVDHIVAKYGGSGLDLKFKIGDPLTERIRLQGNGTITLYPDEIVTDVVGVRLDGFGGVGVLCTSSAGYLMDCTSSVRAIKRDIEPYQNGLDVVLRLTPVRYVDTRDNSPEVGFIAEDVENVEPLLANHRSNGTLTGVDYLRMTAVLVSAAQAQQRQVEELKARVAALERSSN